MADCKHHDWAMLGPNDWRCRKCCRSPLNDLERVPRVAVCSARDRRRVQRAYLPFQRSPFGSRRTPLAKLRYAVWGTLGSLVFAMSIASKAGARPC